MLNNFFVILLFFTFTPIVVKLLNQIKLLIESLIESKKSYSLSEVLNRLTFKEFKIWCIDYLLSLEYQDIMYPTESEADLICKKEKDIYLVKCLRPKKDLTLDQVQIHLGTMVSEKIHKGIIITTSKVSPYVYSYIDNILNGYTIKIISREDLKSEYDEGTISSKA